MSNDPKEKVVVVDTELEDLKRRQARAKVRDPQRGSLSLASCYFVALAP